MLAKLRNRALLGAILTLATAELADAQALVGARASGMAGAYVGVADDASAIYWNPAGIAATNLVSAVIGFGSGETAPSDQPQLAAGQRNNATFVGFSATAFGLGYYRLASYGTTAAEPAVTTPNDREDLRRSVQAITTNNFGVTLVQSITRFVVVGVTPKYVSGAARTGISTDRNVHDALDTASDLEGPSKGVFDADVGVMLALNKWRVGVVSRNLTTPEFPTATPDEEIELARETRAGIGWGASWPGMTKLIVSFDGDIESRATPSGDRRDIAAGVETWWMQQRLAIRGGLKRSTIGEARGAVAAGISAGLNAGTLVEAHVTYGSAAERSWSIGARMLF